MQLKYKIWLDDNGKAFGIGPFHLLLKIEELESINRAASALNMSYSKAWKLVNMAEKKLGIRFLVRETGGNMGGGSKLTKEGKMFLKKYREFLKEADTALNKVFNKYFS